MVAVLRTCEFEKGSRIMRVVSRGEVEVGVFFVVVVGTMGARRCGKGRQGVRPGRARGPDQLNHPSFGATGRLGNPVRVRVCVCVADRMIRPTTRIGPNSLTEETGSVRCGVATPTVNGSGCEDQSDEVDAADGSLSRDSGRRRGLDGRPDLG
jgi:hypothetical protein